MFYVALGVFLVSVNVNDTYVAIQDDFFTYVPFVILWVALFFVYKYESSVNVFYPRPVAWAVKRWSLFLAERKAYNFIRLTHFYAIILSIWLYRIYSEIFLPTHHTL